MLTCKVVLSGQALFRLPPRFVSQNAGAAAAARNLDPSRGCVHKRLDITRIIFAIVATKLG